MDLLCLGSDILLNCGSLLCLGCSILLNCGSLLCLGSGILLKRGSLLCFGCSILLKCGSLLCLGCNILLKCGDLFRLGNAVLLSRGRLGSNDFLCGERYVLKLRGRRFFHGSNILNNRRQRKFLHFGRAFLNGICVHRLNLSRLSRLLYTLKSEYLIRNIVPVGILGEVCLDIFFLGSNFLSRSGYFLLGRRLVSRHLVLLDVYYRRIIIINRRCRSLNGSSFDREHLHDIVLVIYLYLGFICRRDGCLSDILGDLKLVHFLRFFLSGRSTLLCC